MAGGVVSDDENQTSVAGYDSRTATSPTPGALSTDWVAGCRRVTSGTAVQAATMMTTPTHCSGASDSCSRIAARVSPMTGSSAPSRLNGTGPRLRTAYM